MQKLITTFFVMLAIAAVIILGLGFYAQRTVEHSSTYTARVLRENYDSVTHMDRVVAGLSEEERLLLFHLGADELDSASVIRLENRILPIRAKIDQAIQDEINNITLPGEAEAAKRLHSLADAYHDAVQRLIRSGVTTSTSTVTLRGEILSRYEHDVQPLRAEAEREANVIRKMNHDWMEHTARAQAATAPRFILIGTILAVVAMLAGGLQLVRRLRRQAMELQALRTHFVAIAGHELRTPVTSLKMAFEVLSSEAVGPLTPGQRAIVDAGSEDSDRLLTLSRQLLDVTKIQSGQLEVHPVSTEVRPLVSEAVTALRRAIEEKRVTVNLEVNLPPGTRIDADPVKAAWVITNLLANAVRYTPADGTVQISSELAVPGRFGKREIAVHVSDTGPGVPHDIAGKIFQPYFHGHDTASPAAQGAEKPRNQSVGLGLAIAQEIVAAHGGRIWLEPKPLLGRGATVTFTLPLAREDA